MGNFTDPARAVRKSGFTQAELAEMLNMTRSTFNKKLRGWRGQKFSPEDIRTLALHGVAVGELFPEAEPVSEVEQA